MPVFRYKAVTKDGHIVQNKVEESSKFILLRKLKKNELTPISISQINIKISRRKNTQKRNVESSNSALKSIRRYEIQRDVNKNKNNILTGIKDIISNNARITQRDIAIFTQNFYLLKKANFNNIHALSTIINTTENPNLKAILEDILLGVEARR